MTIHFGDSSTLSSFLTVPSSILTGALPALSGASLTNVGKDKRSMDEATSTGVSNTSSTSYQDKVTLSVSTASNTRVLVFFGFEIQNAFKATETFKQGLEIAFGCTLEDIQLFFLISFQEICLRT